MAHAVAYRSAPVRSGVDRALRRRGSRGDRRRTAAALGSAARCGRDGPAHAGRDDVCLFVERPLALQGRGHARALSAADDRGLPAAGRDSGRAAMRLTPGSRLGPYEIVAAIGAGEMGEVYRARDARLQRDVAIKILPDVFAADPERLARFDREARTLAALNHRNIAQVYDAEGGALIMEFVEGDDLAARIAASGAIP